MRVKEVVTWVMMWVVSCVDGLVQVRSWVQKNQCHSITGGGRRSDAPSAQETRAAPATTAADAHFESRHNSLSNRVCPSHGSSNLGSVRPWVYFRLLMVQNILLTLIGGPPAWKLPGRHGPEDLGPFQMRRLNSNKGQFHHWQADLIKVWLVVG